MPRKSPRARKRPALGARVKRSSAERREASREQLRTELLRAAAEIIVAEGYAALSIRRVADRVGYAVTAIYRHFEGKDALIAAVLDDANASFERRLVSAVRKISDPLASCMAMGVAYLDWALQNPAYYRVMFMERPDLVFEDYAATGKLPGSLQLLADAISRLAKASGRPHIDALRLTATLWAFVHGVASLAVVGTLRPPASPRAILEHGAEAIMRGTLAP